MLLQQFVVFFSYVFSLLRISIVVGTIIVNQLIRDGETITIVGGSFELGFFNLGRSKNRYLGILYKKAQKHVVWVTNKESPLKHSIGVLKVTQLGILVVINYANRILWNSNSSHSAQDLNSQLLEFRNLVMKNGNERDLKNFQWQSSEYPCDTFPPGMKFQRNRVTSLNRQLPSWRSVDDPFKGNFCYKIDTSGLPQLLVKNVLVVQLRV